jgi:hypothetical protein
MRTILETIKKLGQSSHLYSGVTRIAETTLPQSTPVFNSLPLIAITIRQKNQ